MISKNVINAIREDFDLEIEEWLKIINVANAYEHIPLNDLYKFTKDEFVNWDNVEDLKILGGLISGTHIVEKVLYIPKMNETYWTIFDNKGVLFVMQTKWTNRLVDWMNYHTGMIARTEDGMKEWLCLNENNFKSIRWKKEE